jgi:hypothetical protein
LLLPRFSLPDPLLSRLELAAIFKNLLDPYTVQMIPAFAYRFLNCSQEHVSALKYFVQMSRSLPHLSAASSSSSPSVSASPLPPGDSLVHMLNIEYSELWSGYSVPSISDYTQRQANLFFSNANGALNTLALLPGPTLILFFSGHTLSASAHLRSPLLMFDSFLFLFFFSPLPGYSVWNKYPADSYFGQTPANLSVPVLMLQGTLDYAAPFWNTLVLAKKYDFVSPLLSRIVLVPYVRCPPLVIFCCFSSLFICSFSSSFVFLFSFVSSRLLTRPLANRRCATVPFLAAL